MFRSRLTSDLVQSWIYLQWTVGVSLLVCVEPLFANYSIMMCTTGTQFEVALQTVSGIRIPASGIRHPASGFVVPLGHRSTANFSCVQIFCILSMHTQPVLRTLDMYILHRLHAVESPQTAYAMRKIRTQLKSGVNKPNRARFVPYRASTARLAQPCWHGSVWFGTVPCTSVNGTALEPCSCAENGKDLSLQRPHWMNFV